MKDTIKVNLPGVKMIAHRGMSGLERENTNAAFVVAGNRSHWGIETDVHRTGDGKFIIIHDETALRVAGVDHNVEENTLASSRIITMKDLDGNPRGDLIFPTLEEYINICRYYDKVSVLELKNHFEPEDLDNIVAAIRACGWLEKTVFISFDLPNCLYIRSILPEQTIQYLTYDFDPSMLDALVPNRLDLDMCHEYATAEKIALCRENGVRVNVWTVDDPEIAVRMAEYGVSYITSNILE